MEIRQERQETRTWNLRPEPVPSVTTVRSITLTSGREDAGISHPHIQPTRAIASGFVRRRIVCSARPTAIAVQLRPASPSTSHRRPDPTLTLPTPSNQRPSTEIDSRPRRRRPQASLRRSLARWP